MIFRRIAIISLATLCSVSICFAGEKKAEASEKPAKHRYSSYFFGHSLVSHGDAKIPTPKEHTTIPYWLNVLSKAAGKEYAVDGQFGFLRTFEMPATARWNFNHVPSAWKGSFANTPYDAVILTAANFVQYQAPDKDFANDSKSPFDVTLNIYDYVKKEAPQAQFYIYENWPELAIFAPGYPDKKPSEKQIATFHKNAQGDFHDWWVDYQDMLNDARPNANIKMIPVGPILGKLLSGESLKSIPITELYEDDAPHGRPSIYFLAALIHFEALYKEKPPKKIALSDSIHPTIVKYYDDIVDFVWLELESFTDKKGRSRVW